MFRSIRKFLVYPQLRIFSFRAVMGFCAIKSVKGVFPVVWKLRGVRVVPIIWVRQVNGHLYGTLGVNHVKSVR